MSESIGSETRLSSSRPDVIMEIRVDEKTGENLFLLGRCSICGDYLPENGRWATCAKKREVICLKKECRCFHEHIGFCRRCFEADVINKRECKVLFLYYYGYKISEMKKLARMTEDIIALTTTELQGRGLLLVKDYWIVRVSDYRHGIFLLEKRV